MLIILVVIAMAVLHLRHKRESFIQWTEFQDILLRSQFEIQEQTMQTIGNDLHDNIGQLLSLTSLTLNSIDTDADFRVKEKVNSAIDLTLRSIKELRQLAHLVQGDQLLNAGLAKAVEHEVWWLQRLGKYHISYQIDDNLPGGDNTRKDLILFRILQEALNNIIKHSSATDIKIEVRYTGLTLILCVTDDGIGFNSNDPHGINRGMGLHNVQKRAAFIGGEVVIRSKPGDGTAITVSVPYT